MSSTRGGADGAGKIKQSTRKSTRIEGAGNVVGQRNSTSKVQGVVVNVFPHQGAHEDLTDSERELLKRYRQTTYEGRLAIQQVAVLAAINRPFEVDR